MTVTFQRPDGTEVIVDGFFNGNGEWKARAYCVITGIVQWYSKSKVPGLNGLTGSFKVTPSVLPGKLRTHPEDPHQFSYDNGKWFLHIGDTGYRYIVSSEPLWREYIDQASEAGFTKNRTWTAKSRHTVEVLFTSDRKGLNFPYWQEIERRLLYALNHHPHFQIHLIYMLKTQRN